jgi:hypothetical protein
MCSVVFIPSHLQQPYNSHIIHYNTYLHSQAFFVIVDPKFGSHLSISNVFDDFKEGFFSRVDARTINKVS